MAIVLAQAGWACRQSAAAHAQQFPRADASRHACNIAQHELVNIKSSRLYCHRQSAAIAYEERTRDIVAFALFDFDFYVEMTEYYFRRDKMLAFFLATRVMPTSRADIADEQRDSRRAFPRWRPSTSEEEPACAMKAGAPLLKPLPRTTY